MRLKVRTIIVAFGLASTPTPIIACSVDPFLFQLPGETVEQANARSEKIGSDFDIVGHFAREKHANETAKVIYLGRIISKVDFNYSAEKTTLPSTTVKPIAQLKGKLPSRNQVLTDEAASGMCDDVGDGHGATTKIGDLVVVFSGLPTSDIRPRGIDSFEVSEIRTVELLDALRTFGKDLED